MPVQDSRHPVKPSGILVDTGTMKRIPKAIWFDPTTGEYEHYMLAPNGVDILCRDDPMREPIMIRGRAKGRLELIPLNNAEQFGLKPPKKVTVQESLAVVTPEMKVAGLDAYKKIFLDVYKFRGESKRCAQDRFDKYVDEIAKNDFLDEFFVLKRRQG